MAWMNRSALNVAMSSTISRPMDERMKRPAPASRGALRPNPSISGPMMNWPTQSPRKKIDRDSSVAVSLAWKARAISSMAERYISVATGGKMESSARTPVMRPMEALPWSA